MAAGKGTRLQEMTANLPKPMVPVGDRPLLAHIVAWLRTHGVTQIAINLHHCPQAITGYFGDGSRHGVTLTYSYEEELLGTAGAAKRLQPFLDEPFVLVYGDVYTNLDLTRLMEFHRTACHAHTVAIALTLSLYRVPNPSECGLVDLDDDHRVRRFVEKPPPHQVFTDLANAGMCVVEPGILDYIPAEVVQDFGRDLFPCLLQLDVPIFGLPIAGDEFLVDIGTPAGLARGQALWQQAVQAAPASQPGLQRP